MPQGASMEKACVISHKCDSDGNPVDNANTNPMLDSHPYEVQFDNREMTEPTVNVIVTSIYAQCDPMGTNRSCLTHFLTIV